MTILDTGGDAGKLSATPLHEDLYKADLAVVERQQAFASEITRLGLAGIAGVAFLFTKFYVQADKDLPALVPTTSIRNLFVAAGISFGIAIAFALASPFAANFAFVHHLKAAKYATQDRVAHTAKIKRHEDLRYFEASISTVLSALAGIFLFLGAGSVALAFAQIVLEVG